MKSGWKAFIIMIVVVILILIICFSIGMLKTYRNKYKDNTCLNQIGAYYCQSNNYKFIDIFYSLIYNIPIVRCSPIRELSDSYLNFKFTEAELRSCGE